MKNPLLALVPVLLLAVAAGAFARDAVASRQGPPAKLVACGCPAPTYLRLSSSATLAGTEDYVELDTDAGVPVVVTLPASPAHLTRVEVWLGAQPGLPGGIGTIDPNGQPATLAPGLSDLNLDQANEGRLLLFVRPTPSGGGYWRVTEL